MNMEIKEALEEFKRLKRKAVDILIENRKLLDANTRELKKNSKPKTYSMEELAEDDTVNTGTVDEADRLLNYSIREYEEWEKKQGRHKENVHVTKSSVNSTAQIAKFTYDKQIKKLQKQKSTNDNRGKISKIRKDPKTGKIVVNDSKQLIKQLAEDLNQTTKERYDRTNQKRQKNSDQNENYSYINEKNKEFNDKLERQETKLLKDIN
ncbi:hypothetical protein Kpol_480p15 [Vanderwaltozyma polyspora DSM 70294]|uniref:Pre-mRNA-splicing factor SYF2 n=1 Tax=Vanderwaltozyma polyspora (strain ATCC 22028 / DSM 70294 / BCRC 21397 / CBS 2163 / NBRC 10782 / NRRL Y-8283 / UCD 57-17) TaxID=436907 RepID=A7TP77_VANPO|nr:uncharacterized protein Kpol_480p15 [Vanderwaltozyma polyspora DSM 70294]EDO15928.1 hypothetical protein Kpol_480p15 [Vanderwaltozyma polyspora DSM 70294]